MACAAPAAEVRAVAELPATGYPHAKCGDADKAADFLCLICTDVSRQPVTCASGAHLFCKMCLTDSLHRKSECPVCREALSVEAILPSPFALSRINAMDISCKHDACGWKGTIARFDAHLQRDCLFEIACPEGCGTPVSGSSIAAHRAVCTPQPVGCCYSALGCGFRSLRRDLPAHESDDKSHFRLLTEFCLGQQATIARLQTDIRAAEARHQQQHEELVQQLQRVQASLSPAGQPTTKWDYEDGDKMIGLDVLVLWGKTLYRGRVTEYRPETKEHRIIYDDKDDRWHLMSEKVFKIEGEEHVYLPKDSE